MTDEMVIHFSSDNDYGDEHFVFKLVSFLEAFPHAAALPFLGIVRSVAEYRYCHTSAAFPTAEFIRLDRALRPRIKLSHRAKIRSPWRLRSNSLYSLASSDNPQLEREEVPARRERIP
jgi:hypothetical protein